jgi:hypothetical protein
MAVTPILERQLDDVGGDFAAPYCVRDRSDARLFGFQQMLKRLHDEHFAVSPRLAKIHELREDSFRLLRINRRATSLAMIVPIQPYSRGSRQTDFAPRKLITSYFRNIDGDLPVGKRSGQECYNKSERHAIGTHKNPPLILQKCASNRPAPD